MPDRQKCSFAIISNLLMHPPMHATVSCFIAICMKCGQDIFCKVIKISRLMIKWLGKCSNSMFERIVNYFFLIVNYYVNCTIICFLDLDVMPKMQFFAMLHKQ